MVSPRQFPGQPAPMKNIQSRSCLVQPEVISSYPDTRYLYHSCVLHLIASTRVQFQRPSHVEFLHQYGSNAVQHNFLVSDMSQEGRLSSIPSSARMHNTSALVLSVVCYLHCSTPNALHRTRPQFVTCVQDTQFCT